MKFAREVVINKYKQKLKQKYTLTTYLNISSYVCAQAAQDSQFCI